MAAKRTALILAVVMVSAAFMLPLFSDDAQGSETGNGVVFTFLTMPENKQLQLKAGGTSPPLHIDISNESAELRYVLFTGVAFSMPDVSHDRDDGFMMTLEAGESQQFEIRVTAERFANSSVLTATFKFEVYGSGSGAPGPETVTMTKNIEIKSRMASENQYNKIMGVLNNPLPEPFDTALCATAVTLAIWLLIAFFAAFVLIPRFVMPILFKGKEKEKRKMFYKKIQRPLFIMILLYGITVCLSVFGAGEYIISMITMGAGIVYILLGTWVGVKIFAAFLDMWEKRAKEDDPDEYDVRDSISPLLLMIGKIVIGMIATAAILSVLGFDLMIIATGAGIIGLAISFGAQSTLAQFFGGITLLVNRPFRSGDLVRLDNGTDTLRVLNVGFMMTTFRNWANSEIFTMPNQKVVSSTIVNVTAESLAYRIIVLVRVPYGTDVTLAKKLALAAMTEHPRILQDGSEEIPKVRLEDFSDSSMTIRVSGFVDDFEDHRTIAAEIREGIYRKYRESGVTIAIPKMDIYVRDPNDREEKY
jgi:small-conductance mechanosensitive channel